MTGAPARGAAPGRASSESEPERGPPAGADADPPGQVHFASVQPAVTTPKALESSVFFLFYFYFLKSKTKRGQGQSSEAI